MTDDAITQDEARERGMFGWVLASVPGFGVHAIPFGDTYNHMDEDCPCKPMLTEDGLWTHNSFDGREAFETGERSPS